MRRPTRTASLPRLVGGRGLNCTAPECLGACVSHLMAPTSNLGVWFYRAIPNIRPAKSRSWNSLHASANHSCTDGLWFCRADPLPLSKVIAAHSPSYLGHKWQPSDLSSVKVMEATTDKPRPGIDLHACGAW